VVKVDSRTVLPDSSGRKIAIALKIPRSAKIDRVPPGRH
jgi:hypothetical protein